MNLYAVNKFSQAVAAVLAAALLTVSALAGGISPAAEASTARASAAHAAIPAAVAQARSKFTIVDQKVTLFPAPSADLSASANVGRTAQSNSAAHNVGQSSAALSTSRTSAAQSVGRSDGTSRSTGTSHNHGSHLSAAPESQLTASTSAASAQVPAGTRARAFARNAQASAAYAGTQQQTRTLNGIKLIAAPYLTEPEHAALTQGAQDKLAALGGRAVSAALLQRALSEVTRYYRDQGFIGAQAYFPVQAVDDGVLSMVVAAPTLNGVSTENSSGVRDSYLKYLLGGIEEQVGLPIEHEKLNNQLLKLTDLGIFSLSGEFSATDVHGLHHDLDLVAAPQRDNFEFSLFADNEGTESSGRYRFGAMADFINVTGSADRLAFFYARTNEQQNNYSLTYELPINSHPTVLGLDFCYSNYELSQAYEVLGAKGHEYNGELYLKEPIYRTATAKTMWRSGLRYRDLTDEFSAFDLEFQKHSIAGYTELSGYKSYPEDHTVFSYRGRLSYGAMYCDDEFEMTEEKNFFLANVELGFNQWWSDTVSYSTGLTLQFANTALDSSEQMQAGGSRGLRAYSSSALVGDSGIVWSNALNLRLYTNERTTHGTTDSTRSYDSYEELTLSPHIEYAKVYDRIYSSDSGASAGITLSYHGHGLNAELDLSHGIGKTTNYADKEGRISFALSYTF